MEAAPPSAHLAVQAACRHPRPHLAAFIFAELSFTSSATSTTPWPVVMPFINCVHDAAGKSWVQWARHVRSLLRLCRISKHQMPPLAHLHTHAAQQQADGSALQFLEARHRCLGCAACGHSSQWEGLVPLQEEKACTSQASTVMQTTHRVQQPAWAQTPSKCRARPIAAPRPCPHPCHTPGCWWAPAGWW